MIKQVGRKIYYDIFTGDVFFCTDEAKGPLVNATTIEQDIETYKALSERNRDTFDVIELEYGQYAQDFTECVGYRVNIEKIATLPDDEKHKALEFVFPDPNGEEPQEPVYQKPLSEEVEELKQKVEMQQLITDDLILNVIPSLLT